MEVKGSTLTRVRVRPHCVAAQPDVVHLSSTPLYPLQRPDSRPAHLVPLCKRLDKVNIRNFRRVVFEKRLPLSLRAGKLVFLYLNDARSECAGIKWAQHGFVFVGKCRLVYKFDKAGVQMFVAFVHLAHTKH